MIDDFIPENPSKGIFVHQFIVHDVSKYVFFWELFIVLFDAKTI